MVDAITFWNEPNNLSHWDFEIDRDWSQFAEMTRRALRDVRALRPDLTLVLGGLSPIDPCFLGLLKSYRLLDELDVVSLHGFPLDWNHWKIDEWPAKIEEIEAVTDLPIWVNDVGASSFGAEEVQVFGLRRMSELLRSELAPHVTATIHPSAILRRQTREEREAEMEGLIEDMRKVADVLNSGD